MANSTEMVTIAQGFEQKWNFPNCCGAIDGKHVEIRKPCSSGSLFVNYKKYFSTVIMAACDHNSRFIWYNIGEFGTYFLPFNTIHCIMDILNVSIIVFHRFV